MLRAFQRYLRDLFYLLPDWPKCRVLEFAPAYFQQTLSSKEGAKRRVLGPAPARPWLSLAELLIAQAFYAHRDLLVRRWLP